ASARAGHSRVVRASTPRRAVHATRQPDRPAVSRPVASRPGNAPPASVGAARRSARTPDPRAGRRRSARQLVLSPLARQIAAIGLALCAVALSLAYPLRGYLEQQSAERVAVAQRAALQDQIAELTAKQAALEDPAYIKAEAKRRLQYVSPGDTVYVVKVPGAQQVPATTPASGTTGDSTNGSGAPADAPETAPAWYSGLWDTLAHGTAPVG
ncbi:MAG TPA: septum formation initiator family protein, partial [Nakamurella sp.]